MNVATPAQVQIGDEIRNVLVLMMESSKLQKESSLQYNQILNARKEKNRLIREINLMDYRIAEDTIAGRDTTELEILRNGLLEEKSEILGLLNDNHELERDLLYEINIQKRIAEDFEIRLRDLLRQNRVCRVRNEEELHRLGKLGMNYSPIISTGDRDLLDVANSECIGVLLVNPS